MKHMITISLLCGGLIHILHAQTYVVPPAAEMPPALNGPRISSAPYVSGDTFRSIATFIIDEKKIPFDPTAVKDGDIIFIRPHDLDFFFTTVHPLIGKHYILVTHNSDHSAPGKFIRYLDDEKIIAWFGQNPDGQHEKFFPIPIGLANAYWAHGNVAVIKQVQHEHKVRDILLYLNIDNTHPDRIKVKKMFEKKPFCSSCTRKSYPEYLRDLKRSQFVLSPRGNGLDCHRHWEVLLMGGIPIIQHSSLDPLFEGLPVILVDDYAQVTENFLQACFATISQSSYHPERMYAAYWIAKIVELQEQARHSYQAR